MILAAGCVLISRGVDSESDGGAGGETTPGLESPCEGGEPGGSEVLPVSWRRSHQPRGEVSFDERRALGPERRRRSRSPKAVGHESSCRSECKRGTAPGYEWVPKSLQVRPESASESEGFSFALINRVARAHTRLARSRASEAADGSEKSSAGARSADGLP